MSASAEVQRANLVKAILWLACEVENSDTKTARATLGDVTRLLGQFESALERERIVALGEVTR